LHHYVTTTPVRVDEGGSAPFSMNISGIINFLRTKAAIPNPEVSIKLIKQPHYGHVMLLPDLNLTVYSRNEIESGKIAYFHDHSDTKKDQIDFTIYFSPGHVILCNITILVDITPINDEPFKLELVNAIDVVQNQTQTITRDNLLTTDPDTDPNDIIYEIINAPTYGRLLLLSTDENSNTEIHQAQKFTQRDIDSSRLVYEHMGPLLLSTFYFRVSDGRFNPIYKIFNINIHPIKLSISVLKPIDIQQGLTSTTIDTESLKLDTNVRQDLVSYEVTKPPTFGTLHVREQMLNFKHMDLLSKSVVYVQQDMTVSNDSFELLARVSNFEFRNIHVSIRVVPLMLMNPNLEVYAGDRSKLSITYFDAMPLAKLAKSDPAYKITRKPKYAKIMRIINRTMSSGEKRGLQEKEVTRFSHSQILSGLIYLVCRKVPTDDIQGVIDNFEFILAVPQSAPRFQPAMGVFDFRVKLVSDYYNNSLDGPMDPVGHEGEMTIAPNMSSDYTLLLGMLFGVFFLGICVIVTIRCRQSRYKDTEEEDEEEDQNKVEPSSPTVMPLPRPPDHLLPATPHLKRYTNEHHNKILSSSTPLPPIMPSLTSTLPQCKVNKDYLNNCHCLKSNI
jgi:chondroitin sulfate proteoglycan 4